MNRAQRAGAGFDPARARALAERLIAIPSVSPDLAGETRCGRALLAALPPGIERGAWRLRDRREVVWGRLRAGSPVRTRKRREGRRRLLLLLGHHDTVGVSEFARLGAPEGEKVAFAPRRLRERLRRHAATISGLPPEDLSALRADLGAGDEWLFGRGALDMKSGLAAGVAALGRLVGIEDLGGDVMLISCPDEERESAGMLGAVRELARLRTSEKVELLGAINLDYGEGPLGYAGLMGKRLAGVYVLGSSGHAAAPHQGADAAQMAAAIVHHATLSPTFTERLDGAPAVAPVALALRDLKPEYNAQTAAEAVVELNLMTAGRGVAETLETLRQVVREALDEVASRMEALGPRSRPRAHPARRAAVLTFPELAARAPRRDSSTARRPRRVGDLREASLERVRSLAREAGLPAPAVVLYLAPPFHPHAPPGSGPLTSAARAVLTRQRRELRSFYPFISDASYLSWHAESPEKLSRYLPALGAEYQLPAAESRALGLEVVNLGPWGRDAHGLLERVHAPYAFEALPRLIADVAAQALRE